MARRKFKRRSKKKKSPILKLLFWICFLGAAFVIYRSYKLTFKDNVNANSETVIYIPTGASYQSVVDSLKAKGILKDFFAFDVVAKLKSYPELVRPGKYKIGPDMSNNDLVNMFRSGSQELVKVQFNTVESLEQLAGVIAEQIEADSLDLLISMYANKYNRYSINEKNLSCIYIPNTYEFYWSTDAEGFVRRMILEFETFWNEERRRKAADLNLSLPEVVTLASIVQKEVLRQDELPVVAGLYLNRLRRGMKLQADPTVIFALKKELNPDTVIKRVLYKDLKFESEYNTYIYKGLPPGPICLPSVKSIDAVLNATEHNYLYMCAKEDFSGYHNFAATAREHNINKRKWTRALNERRIMR